MLFLTWENFTYYQIESELKAFLTVLHAILKSGYSVVVTYNFRG